MGIGANLETSLNHHVEHHRPVSAPLYPSDVSISLMAESLTVLQVPVVQFHFQVKLWPSSANLNRPFLAPAPKKHNQRKTLRSPLASNACKTTMKILECGGRLKESSSCTIMVILISSCYKSRTRFSNCKPPSHRGAVACRSR